MLAGEIEDSGGLLSLQMLDAAIMHLNVTSKCVQNAIFFLGLQYINLNSPQHTEK